MRATAVDRSAGTRGRHLTAVGGAWSTDPPGEGTADMVCPTSTHSHYRA